MSFINYINFLAVCETQRLDNWRISKAAAGRYLTDREK